MPPTMLFEFRHLKLLLKTHTKEEILTLLPDHGYNTRTKSLKIIKANNKRGGRSLLYTGVKLCNRYLLEDLTGSGSDPMFSLAERLLVYAKQWVLADSCPTSLICLVPFTVVHWDSRHSSFQAIWLSPCFYQFYSSLTLVAKHFSFIVHGINNTKKTPSW